MMTTTTMRGGGVSQSGARYSYSSSSSSSSSSQKRQTISDKNQNMLYYLLAITSFTVGASYASVPLYRAFCRATGFGGTTQRKSIEDKMQEREQMDKSVLEKAKKRSIEVTFNADVAEGLPWKFTPTQKKVTVTPGETVLAFYTAENTSSSAITGVATYNVQPGKAGQYFNKIQCFCFEEQRLRAKEKVDMPVFFYLDPEFASDRGMEDVNSLVLSYTFFQSEDFDGDEYDESRDDEKGGGGVGKEEGGVKLHGSGVGPDGRKL
jgi:cytochrome c oxidase assembly protein subunit 11